MVQSAGEFGDHGRWDSRTVLQAPCDSWQARGVLQQAQCALLSVTAPTELSQSAPPLRVSLCNAL